MSDADLAIDERQDGEQTKFLRKRAVGTAETLVLFSDRPAGQ